MKKLLSIVSATLLGAVVSLVAVGPAVANTNVATISGNVISMPTGFAGYNNGVGHMVHLCAGANVTDCGIVGFSLDFATTLGATTMTFWSTDQDSNGQPLGEGPYTIAVRHSSPGFLAGNFTNVILPAFVQTAPPASSQSSGRTPAPFDPATAPPPAVGLALQASVGSKVENSPVSFTGTTMKSGANYILTVNSDPIVLAQGVVAENGRINGLPRLPALPPGTHTLRLTTTGWDGSSVTISQVFVVGEDGRLISISDPVGAVTPVSSERDTLAYTGLQSSTLPWWALVLLNLGLVLLVYSVRAQAMMSRPELREALLDARGPWEILATPIRVPGIDYTPDGSATATSNPSLGDAIRELDLAFSKMIADQLEKVTLPAFKA